jgi:hypothetical protein
MECRCGRKMGSVLALLLSQARSGNCQCTSCVESGYGQCRLRTKAATGQTEGATFGHVVKPTPQTLTHPSKMPRHMSATKQMKLWDNHSKPFGGTLYIMGTAVMISNANACSKARVMRGTVAVEFGHVVVVLKLGRAPPIARAFHLRHSHPGLSGPAKHSKGFSLLRFIAPARKLSGPQAPVRPAPQYRDSCVVLGVLRRSEYILYGYGYVLLSYCSLLRLIGR